ncbi:MAG TPA: hypothetical protein VI685_04510 [Candidatus Angelobacter sp.]
MKDLRRLLWRYDAGLLSTEQITGRFEEDMSELVSAYREVLSESGGDSQTGGREHKFCVAFDQAVNSARSYVLGRNFKRALEQLRFATAASRQLELLAHARREIQHAQDSSKALFEAIGSAAPNSLLAYEIVRRLLMKSQNLLDRGDLRQSRFVASMCLHECQKLLRVNEPGAEEVQALRTQIAGIRTVQGTLSHIPFREGDTSIFAGLATVERLVAEGRLILAKCMLDDLKVAMRSRTGFLSEVARQLGKSWLNSKNVLSLLQHSGITAQDSWESATDRLLEHALSRLEVKVRELASTVRQQTTDEIAVSA